VADELDLFVERVCALMAAYEQGACLPRSEVEPTLTEGYARALELDAQCLRLEHRIDRLTREVAEGRDVPRGKLAGLLLRLHETEQRCLELRALLAPLRELVAKAA
jgi:hypothetical protein